MPNTSDAPPTTATPPTPSKLHAYEMWAGKLLAAVLTALYATGAIPTAGAASQIAGIAATVLVYLGFAVVCGQAFSKMIPLPHHSAPPTSEGSPAPVSSQGGFVDLRLMAMIAILAACAGAITIAAFSGCATSSQQTKTLVTCSEDAAVKALEPTVIEILDTGGADWSKLLTALATGFGPDEIDCVVAYAKAELVKKYGDAASSASAIQRADEWLNRKR